MIKINNIKIPVTEPESQLPIKIKKMLKGIEIGHIKILKKSLDARKKGQLLWVYQVAVEIAAEDKFLNKKHSASIEKYHQLQYKLPENGSQESAYRPVIIGTGPAGMFCGLALARKGLRPIILERGKQVNERMEDVEHFWRTGVLKPDSNVQFGEGGAGTFSDGKLNTLVKDTYGRNRAVLEDYVRFGAPESILYLNKPHIGTDLLVSILKNMRQEIISLGGNIRFESQVIDFCVKDKQLVSIFIDTKGEKTELKVETVVLAIGHSARDTFQVLFDRGLEMEAKSFAVGFRVEHSQELINQNQYGTDYPNCLLAAPYKLTGLSSTTGRSVYSFCMCPGGYIVNASSEPECLAVNGMSYHNRGSKNANSAIIVSVTPDDYPTSNPLGGVAFQREIEQKAYLAGQGKIPQQLLNDFRENKASTNYNSILSEHKGQAQLTNCRDILPEALNLSFLDGMDCFGQKMKGFNDPDVVISGIESRTSSPVRITRNDRLQANWNGLYPCGEGAGYAGGIMSAAMDGLKVAEQIITKYQKIDE